MKKLVGIKCKETFFSQISSITVPLIERVFSAISILSLFCNPIIYIQYEQYMLVYQLWVTCWLLNHGSSFFFQKKIKGPICSDGDGHLASVSQTRTSTLHVCPLHICPQRSLCLKQLYQNGMKVILQVQMRTSGKISV